VLLDERGLFQSQGDAPTPYAPLFNEFLIDFIRKNNLSVGNNLRIEWDDLRRLMYISVSFSEELEQFERAYVLYPSLDKWGVFNEPHYGIVPIQIDGNTRAGQYFGYVGLDKRVRFWDDFPSREVLPVEERYNLRYPLIQKNSFEAEGGNYQIASSAGVVNSLPTLSMLGTAGYYANESNTPATPELTGLNAKVQVGLIRFPELGDSFDRMTEIVSLMLGNVESGSDSQLSEDYLIVPPGVDDQDYEAVAGTEDFGEGVLAYVNHDLRIISTLDGRTLFQEATPQLVQFTEAARHYSCSTQGIWHILEVSANSPGQAFHLQAFELNATDAGKLS
jgi:hypothetical protein